MSELVIGGRTFRSRLFVGTGKFSSNELMARSIAQGGMPVEFPDFTRGDWKTTMPLAVVS